MRYADCVYEWAESAASDVCVVVEGCPEAVVTGAGCCVLLDCAEEGPES